MARISLDGTTLFKDSALLSFYPFEGNSNDAKGSVNGTATNITYSTVNAVFNQGGRSPGAAGDGVNFGNNFNFTSGDFSFLVWVYPESFENAHFILSKGSSSVDGYGLFYSGTSGALTFRTNQSSAAQDTTTSTLLDLSTFQLLAVTRSGSTVKLYKNGVEMSYSASGTHTNPATTTTDFFFTRYNDSNTALGSVMRFDEFAVFNRVLTAAEILSVYKSDAYYGGMI